MLEAKPLFHRTRMFWASKTSMTTLESDAEQSNDATVSPRCRGYFRGGFMRLGDRSSRVIDAWQARLSQTEKTLSVTERELAVCQQQHRKLRGGQGKAPGAENSKEAAEPR